MDGKELVTRPLGQDILAGVTRQTLISIARESNLKVTERPFSIDEALAAKEAFVTSTTAFVMPVVAIDDTQIGDGKPGDVAVQLFDAYRRYIDRVTDGN